jgi:hypothetical protein
MATKKDSIAIKEAIEEIEKMIKDYKKMKTDDELPEPENVQRFTHEKIAQGLEIALEVLKKRVI